MNEQHEEYMALAREIMRRCMAEEEPENVHGWLQANMDRLHGKVNGDDGESGIMWWEDTFGFYDGLLQKRAEQAAIAPHLRKSLAWPWGSWNKLIDPLPGGLLATISAPDGQGKTMYAECLAEEWARQRNRVVYVHYELNHAIMMDRRYSRHCGLTIRELKTGRLTAEQQGRVRDAHAKLRQWEGLITYQHSAGWTMEQTISRLKRLQDAGKCDVVIVDYLEKNAASQRQLKTFGTNLYQREADNVEQLKNFAENADLPVVMIAQMNKESKVNATDRTGIRGAGEKTEKANLVVLLHRDWDSVTGDYSKLVSVRVDKNTLGSTGSFEQMLMPQFFRVHDLAEG